MTSMWKNYSKKHSMIKFYSKLTNTDNLHSKGDNQTFKPSCVRYLVLQGPSLLHNSTQL